MTKQLPDTIRHLLHRSRRIHRQRPSGRAGFRESPTARATAGAREKASLLYKAVRDGIRYNPYVDLRATTPTCWARISPAATRSARRPKA